MQKKEIISLEEVQELVDTFYERVRADESLGPIFEQVIQDRWPAHLAKMYQFWQTILLEEHTYSGRPFPPHARLPIEKAHFDRWIMLFTENIDAQFEGEKATEAKYRANIMAQLFSSKIEHIRNSSMISIQGV